MSDQIKINRARITGKGVELKTSKQGKPYATFTAMWSSSRKNNNTGQWENGPTKFLNVTVFGTQAELLTKWAQPKTVVSIYGRIEHFEWQSQTGPTDDWKLIADMVAPVDSSQANQQVTGGYGGQGSRQQGSQNDVWNSTPQQPFAVNNEEPPF